MADCDNTFRITSITDGTAFAQPVGFSLRASTTWMKNFPGTRKAPCTALDKWELSGTATYQGHETPHVVGTSTTLAAVLSQMDGGTSTYSTVRMIVGAFGLNARNSSMAECTQDYEYDSSTSDDLAPISVS